MSDRASNPPEGDEPLLPSDWQGLAPLIDVVLDAAPEERAALIIRLCGGDGARERALAHLVAECERDTPLLEGVAGERFGGLAPEPEVSLLPAVIGDRYRTGRELGHGGMARVYLARDLKHGRDVAIKVIRPELSASLGHDRFLREIEIAARLRHPNIVPLYDSGEVGTSLYFVMPFEEGPSLRERLTAEGALPISDALGVLRDVARALAYAHEHGVVHRDVKPDNVMLSGGAAVVTDFGIAKAVSAALTEVSGPTLTQSGSAIGTPAYMAPEQATGDPTTDHRADIYSFGCLAYELLTGKPPFPDQPIHQVIAAHIGTVPGPVSSRRVDIPPAMERLVAHCLEKNPGERPQTAREVLGALEDLAITGSGGRVLPAAKSRRGRVWALWAGLALAAGAIATVAYLKNRGSGTARPISLALLPFGNSGADTTIGYLAEGLPGEVGNALRLVPGIQIKSQNGAMIYRGQLGVDATEAGARLGVDYIVSGVVRHEGDRWILSLELQRAADKTSLWGEILTFGEDGMAGAASLIAEKMSTAMRGLFPNTVGVVSVAASPPHAVNPQAYRLYLIGKDRLNRRGQSVANSIPFFREAISLDTLSAEAYSGLSLALALTPRLQGVSPVPFVAEAEAYARRALLLNPRRSEPHVALGMLREYELGWGQAETEYQTAIGLDPHDVEARIQYGAHLRIRGRLAESLRQDQLARDDDPASAVVASHLSYAWYLEGQLDSALAEGARAQQMDPDNLTTAILGAQMLAGLGRPAEARRLVGTLRRTSGITLWVLGKLGERDSVLDRLRIIDTTRPTPGLAYSWRAQAMLGLGDTARALDAMERATDAREMWFWGLVTKGPILAPIMGSARMHAVLRRVKLEP